MIHALMRPALFVLLLVAALPAFAWFDFEPIAPTDRSAVVLQVRGLWGDGCLPKSPKVTRSANTIEILWTRLAAGCSQALRPWNTDVPLGVLEAGEYEVTLRSDVALGSKKLVVTEAEPALLIEPRLLSSVVATEVTVVSVNSEFCPLGPQPKQVVVTVDGVTVPSRIEQCSLVTTFPPHAPGPATVQLRVDGRVIEVVAAVHYVDPEATPEASLFERVLVPVLFDGPGALGSQWVTEAEMINRSGRPLTWLPRAAHPLSTLDPYATASLSVFGNRASGLVLFLPRGHDVRFGSVFRDVSRDGSQWGTELPVVREGKAKEAVILSNVPFDPRYRLQLRIYGIEGASFPVIVVVSRDGVGRSGAFTVAGPCRQEELPCNSNQPAFRSIDLGQAFPTLAGGGRHRVTVLSDQPFATPRLWAFVTVTNNETQHVTAITPQ